jgi:cyclohexanecarboxylate-CoA ligase
LTRQFRLDRWRNAILAHGGPSDALTLEALLSQTDGPADRRVMDDRQVMAADDVTEASARLAGGLRAAGVGHGDLVAWQMPNCIEVVLLYRACWRLGAIAAPIHDRAGEREVGALFDLLDPKLRFRAADEVTRLAEHPPLTAIDAAPEDLAVVLLTAGSTGRPKGVLHTHRSLAGKARSMVSVHGLSITDVVLMPAPLAHVSGLLNGVLVPGAAGMSTVLVRRWSPADALQLIEREQVSFMVGPPTFFIGLMEEPSFSAAAVSSLRLVSCGGAGVSEAFARRASMALGATVKRSYGSTEAPTVASSIPADPPDRAMQFDGHAVGEAELRVVDPVTLAPVGPDTEGELWVRGPELFAGYLSTETDEAGEADESGVRAGAITPDGWFRTGDLARLTSDGWLTVTGRLDELIIRGGENIAPTEVERLLEEHPAVSRAVVVGVPDDRLGERVGALVVPNAPSAGGTGDVGAAEPAPTFDVADCREWFAARGVARFKTPEHIVLAHELPLLPSGKVDRRAVLDLVRGQQG